MVQAPDQCATANTPFYGGVSARFFSVPAHSAATILECLKVLVCGVYAGWAFKRSRSEARIIHGQCGVTASIIRPSPLQKAASGLSDIGPSASCASNSCAQTMAGCFLANGMLSCTLARVAMHERRRRYVRHRLFVTPSTAGHFPNSSVFATTPVFAQDKKPVTHGGAVRN